MTSSRKNVSKSLIAGCIAMTSLVSCQYNRENNDITPEYFDSKKATVAMHLKGTPAYYDAVNIDIQSVQVKMYKDGVAEFLPIRPGIYNMDKLRNGIDTLLLKANVIAGNIAEIRVILGPNNTVVENGLSYPLTAPNGGNNPIILNIDHDFAAMTTTDLWLDFDARKSVMKTGVGTYAFAPTITAYTAETDGRLGGYVYPAGAMVQILVTSGGKTYSTIPNADGYYLLTGLPKGNYSVTYDAAEEAYQDETVNDITVDYTGTTTATTVTLKQ